MKLDKGIKKDDVVVENLILLELLHWQLSSNVFIFFIFFNDSTIVNVNVPIIKDKGIAKNGNDL